MCFCVESSCRSLVKWNKYRRWMPKELRGRAWREMATGSAKFTVTGKRKKFSMTQRTLCGFFLILLHLSFFYYYFFFGQERVTIRDEDWSPNVIEKTQQASSPLPHLALINGRRGHVGLSSDPARPPAFLAPSNTHCLRPRYTSTYLCLCPSTTSALN